MKKAFYQEIWDTIKIKRETYNKKLINKRKNGKKYNARVIIKPVVDEDTKLIGFIGLEKDLGNIKE